MIGLHARFSVVAASGFVCLIASWGADPLSAQALEPIVAHDNRAPGRELRDGRRPVGPIEDVVDVYLRRGPLPLHRATGRGRARHARFQQGLQSTLRVHAPYWVPAATGPEPPWHRHCGRREDVSG